jgi:hypothetical protein
MKVNLVEVPTPMFSSFTMFAEPDLKLLKETKKISVSFHHNTKTRISTSISFGNYRVKVNNLMQGYKQHEERNSNYFSGGVETSYYFVKSKAQNYEVYKEFLTKLIPYILTDFFRLELDEITIELEQREF